MRYVARAPLRIDLGGGWTDMPAHAEADGGAALTAAITRYVRGSISWTSGQGMLRVLRSDRSYLAHSIDVPAGAGLGASAAHNVMWAALVRAAFANTATRADIAEIAAQIGAALGILKGKQDEYASALGGLNYLTFSDRVGVERLGLEPSVVDALHARLLLVYSGQSRPSREVPSLVWQRYRSGETGVRAAMSALGRIAGDMRQALLAGDLEGFGALIEEDWSQQKALHPAITTPGTEGLIERALRAGAAAAKPCGAGAGGCVLLFAHEDATDRVRAAVHTRRTPIIDFDFDSYGVHVRK